MKRIILIAGRSQAGKDTTANIIYNTLIANGHSRNDINITHFADKLKLLSYKLLKDFYPELDPHAFYDKKDEYNEFLKTKNRTFLQYLGTYSKDMLGDNIWVESVNITDGINIIADHRFITERKIIEKIYPEHLVSSIRIFREIVDNKPITHESEKIDFRCDINIYNNLTLDSLNQNIKKRINEIIYK